MPSVAVVVNGCIREVFESYNNLIDNINENFKNFDIIDIYFHTWHSFPNTDLIRHEYNYDEKALVELLNKKKNVKKIIFENQYTKEYLDSINFPYNQFLVSVNYIYPTRTSIYACFSAFRSLLNAVKESGIEYDYILRTRNDIIVEFSNMDSIIKEANQDKLCLPNIGICIDNDKFVNDHWLFGKTEHMSIALDYKDLESFKEIVRNSWNQEEITKKIMLSAGRPLYFADVLSYLVVHENRRLK